MLDIVVASCNPVQYQRKLMRCNLNKKIMKTLISRWGDFFIVPSYHPMQFPGKIMNQTWENGKRSNFLILSPNLGLHFFLLFSPVLPLLVVRHCTKLSSYAIYRKTNEPNLRKSGKEQLILGLILAHLAQIWASKKYFMSYFSSGC